MLAKCVNPDCGAKFQYYGKGKLLAAQRPQASRVEFFWLCEACATEYRNYMRRLESELSEWLIQAVG